MSDYIPHNCPKEDYDEVLVPSGHPCPNGCGWIACDGDLEEFAIQEAAKALALWGPWTRLSDAARETGIAFSSIAQAAREGRLPYLQIGRQKFVRASAVRARLSNQRGRPEGAGQHRSRKIIDRGGKCELCGATEHLNVHHIDYEKNELQILCIACHRKAHTKASTGKKSGTPPNTSLILTDIELEFINEHFHNSKSAAIHYALERLMDEM